MPGKIKNICFTHNNYQAEDEERYRNLVPSTAKYVLFGREVGESGTPHLQGLILLTETKSYSELHQLLPGAHITGTRSVIRSLKYCKKDGDFEEHGECPRVSDRKSLSTCGEVSRYVQQHGVRKARQVYHEEWSSRGHIIMRNLYMPGRNRVDIECVWIWGPPGTGKSRLAHQILPNAFRKNPRTKWWHGYEFEKSCIIDDFAPDGVNIDYLLRWLDRYPCRVETKGGEMELYAEQFVITSNFMPEECYPNHKQLPALMRRITIARIDIDKQLTFN